jgi:hypothetical protein
MTGGCFTIVLPTLVVNHIPLVTCRSFQPQVSHEIPKASQVYAAQYSAHLASSAGSFRGLQDAKNHLLA